jgi:hypothetical protein
LVYNTKYSVSTTDIHTYYVGFFHVCYHDISFI